MNKIEKIINDIGRVSSYAVLFLTVWMIGIIIIRGVFNYNSIGAQEVAVYFYAIFFMIGISYGSCHDSHTRIDVFSGKFSDKQKAWVEFCGILFLIVPICILIIAMGSNYAFESWGYGEASANSGGLSYLYLQKSLIPLSATLLLLRELVSLSKVVSCLRSYYL